MNTKPAINLLYQAARFVKQNGLPLLFYFVHPALLILTGYCLVGLSLPLIIKTGLLGAVCLGPVLLFYPGIWRSS